MTEILIFVLAASGLTNILVYGKIFNRIRPNYKFFECSQCMGFHVGWFLWAINDFTQLFTFDYSLATAFVLACVSSGTSYVLDKLIGDDGINVLSKF